MRLVNFLEYLMDPSPRQMGQIFVNPEQVTSVKASGYVGITRVVIDGAVHFVSGDAQTIADMVTGTDPAPERELLPDNLNSKVISEGVALAAMCIFELWLDPLEEHHKETKWFKALQQYRDDWGVFGLRSNILNTLTPAAQELWEHFRAHDEFDGSFDWEFLPIWLDACVDWVGGWAIKPGQVELMMSALGR